MAKNAYVRASPLARLRASAHNTLDGQRRNAGLRIKFSRLPRTLALFASVQMLYACGGENRDDTAAVQSAVDRGGVVKFDPRVYYLSRTIVIHRSNTVLQGAGPQTVFQFQASSAKEHCANDRVFTTPCEVYFDQPSRRIAQAIAIGDSSFFATDDASDIQPGDWLLITDQDAVIGDVVTSDWVQALSVVKSEIQVYAPFRTAFANSRPWQAGISGLGFRRIVPLIENTEFRNFNVVVPMSTTAVGISVVAARHTTIDHVIVESFNGQPLYSYVSEDVSVTNSDGRGHAVLNEFAATVDLSVRGNRFGVDDSAALGLDLGTGYFDVSNNAIAMSRNIGGYLLYGVHDGRFGNNSIDFVTSSGNAVGILAWGTQNIAIADNYLAGGAGPESTGISVRSYAGAIVIPSINVTLSGNTFGSGWAFDYVPGRHASR